MDLNHIQLSNLSSWGGGGNLLLSAQKEGVSIVFILSKPTKDLAAHLSQGPCTREHRAPYNKSLSLLAFAPSASPPGAFTCICPFTIPKGMRPSFYLYWVAFQEWREREREEEGKSREAGASQVPGQKVRVQTHHLDPEVSLGYRTMDSLCPELMVAWGWKKSFRNKWLLQPERKLRLRAAQPSPRA
jgi:hypothetical protein